MPANSKASQLLNWFGNFMNGVSNAARDVVANPLADMANIKLKTNPYVAAANLATKWKVNKAIDTVTSAAKWEQPNSLQKQPNDPTSIAQAAWEWLTRWIDLAASVLTLTDLARQLPKAAQAWWKTILNKVKDAKSKSDQMKLAKEARAYIDQYATDTTKLAEDVPSYQKRAVAAEANLWKSAADPKMEKFAGQYYNDQSMKTFDNLTDKMKNKDNVFKDYPKDVRKVFREWEILDQIQKQDSRYKYLWNKVLPNQTYVTLNSSEASQLWVPYGWKNMQNIRNVQKEIQDLVKMSDKDFKKLMQDKAAASTAWYGDWRYNLWDDWIENWNNPKEYQRMKEEIAGNILNDAWLNYWVAETYGNAIMSNAAKSSKRYRNWLKKDAKNRYEKATQPITRAERNAADMNAAEVEKKKIMDQYWISSKDYDEYADAAANTYIYIDKNWNPVDKMAWAGWPSGWSYFIDEKAEVMPYLKWYAKRHPTVDEYIRMSNEEAELGRLAEAEAEDIAREAWPAYDWSL